MLGVRILATGTAVPQRVVTTDEVLAEAMPDRDPSRIRDKIGMERRHWVSGDESAASLGAAAVRQALDRAGIEATSLRRLVFIDSTGGDQQIPPTSNEIAARLGVHGRCGCMDLNNACVGFLTGMDLAARLVATGEGPIAIVASETLTRGVHADLDPRSYVIFGDAAAAAILDAPTGDEGMLASDFGNDGRHRGAVHLAHGGRTGERVAIRFGLRSDEIAKLAVPDLLRSCHAVLDRAEVELDAVQHVLVHQANGAFLATFLDALGVGMERSVDIVTDLGSIGAASVAMALDRILQSGRASPGDLVLIGSVGGGTSRGAVLWRLGPRTDR